MLSAVERLKRKRDEGASGSAPDASAAAADGGAKKAKGGAASSAAVGLGRAGEWSTLMHRLAALFYPSLYALALTALFVCAGSVQLTCYVCSNLVFWLLSSRALVAHFTSFSHIACPNRVQATRPPRASQSAF